MKRILTLLMTVSLLLCLAACGQPADHAPEQSPQQAESIRASRPDRTPRLRRRGPLRPSRRGCRSGRGRL